MIKDGWNSKLRIQRKHRICIAIPSRLLTINCLFVFSVDACCFDELSFDTFNGVGLLICIEMNSESINHFDKLDNATIVMFG